MAGDEPESFLTYAGIGGAIACCAALELLGGAALLGGLAAVIGFSTGLTYLVVIGVGGIITALLVLGYHQYGGTSNA